jgi:DNA-binding protein YbaB
MMPEEPSVTAGDLAALEGAIAETTAELERLRAATYQGQDRARLVTAVVDGEGIVVKVTFTPSISRYEPDVVGDAVRAAVGAAQERLGQAIGAVVARVAPVPPPDRRGSATDATGFSGTVVEVDNG